jgi:hypothetical protein
MHAITDTYRFLCFRSPFSCPSAVNYPKSLMQLRLIATAAELSDTTPHTDICKTAGFCE